MTEQEEPKKILSHKQKHGDGGMKAAIASFFVLCFYFFMRSSTGKEIFGNHYAYKLSVVLASFLLSVYAFYRKLRYHDYSHKHQFTSFLIFVNFIVTIPLIIIYLVFG